MEYNEFKGGFVAGIKEAFKLEASTVVLDDDTDMIDDGSLFDWELSVGGEGDDLIKLCGEPVEIIASVMPQDDGSASLPCELGIQIVGGYTMERDRVNDIIDKIEEELGYQIVFNEVSEDDFLIMDFGFSVAGSDEIRQTVVDLIGELSGGKIGELTKELLQLCSVRD